MPICLCVFFSTIVGLSIIDCTHKLLSLFTIGLANTFAMVATCAFNDAEDVTEDSFANSTRNVIALGKASKDTGYLVAAVAAVISIILAIISGITVFLIILALLITTFLYSWRPVRLKTKPFWDVCTHFIMGGLMFLSSAWSSQDGVILGNHVLSIGLIFSLGTALALLTHQLYDYENDLTADFRTTVITLGKRKVYWLEVGIYFFMGCLLTYEYTSGIFPFVLILSFLIVACSLILGSIALFPQHAFQVSKRIFPWAINSGALSAIITWYIIW